MNDEGKQMSAWLKRVTKDQNLNQLSELENVPYDTLRQLFLSAQLQPDIIMGYYNTASDRIVLGNPSAPPQLNTDIATMSVQISTASAATATLTCPAGHVYRVISANITNGTRAHTPQLTYTPSGGAATNIVGNTGTTSAAAVKFPTIGGCYMGGSNTTFAWTGANGIWLQAGDVLTLTDGAFVALDAMAHHFIFEDFEV